MLRRYFEGLPGRRPHPGPRSLQDREGQNYGKHRRRTLGWVGERKIPTRRRELRPPEERLQRQRRQHRLQKLAEGRTPLHFGHRPAPQLPLSSPSPRSQVAEGELEVEDAPSH